MRVFMVRVELAVEVGSDRDAGVAEDLGHHVERYSLGEHLPRQVMGCS
jgi:hypothetical protein